MSAAGKVREGCQEIKWVLCLQPRSKQPVSSSWLSRMRYLLCCADQRSANLPIPYIASGFQRLWYLCGAGHGANRHIRIVNSTLPYVLMTSVE